MRGNTIISILDVLLTETTFITKANPGLVESGTTTAVLPVRSTFTVAATSVLLVALNDSWLLVQGDSCVFSAGTR